VNLAALLYHQTKRTAVIEIKAAEKPHTHSTLFMRLYTGNRGGAKERRFFFAQKTTRE